MLDLTFPKKVIANTVKFSCFFTTKEGGDCAKCTFSPASRSGRR